MGAFYNENDPKAAAWLRELISRGLIADGVVDERDVRDLRPADLHGFAQCHFFAGIGVWSYALRQAGWADDRPVWTGSCPCQPFSAAGKGAGFDDERHLWPAWHWLISQCRPAILFGEQVASKNAEPWIDLVQDDLEALGYCVGAVPFPAAGIGAPHIRDRLYWVADASYVRWPRVADPDDAGPQGWIKRRDSAGERAARESGVAGGLADSERIGREWGRPSEASGRQSFEPAIRPCDAGGLGNAKRFSTGRDSRAGDRAEDRDGSGSVGDDAGPSGPARSLAHASSPRHEQAREHERGPSQLPTRPAQHGGVVRPAGPTNGLWRDADWLLCRDGKWRPVEPGTAPLAHGAPARVGRLRGYGNAICAPAAQAFIEAYLGVAA